MRIIQLLTFIVFSLSLTAQNLTHYKLSISPADLENMYANAKEEEFFPAEFQIGEMTYQVQARFKGSTSLYYPKKSWQIRFENNNNVTGYSKLNLHADYKDYSFMRNFLILKLFDHLGYPASKIKHVTFEVNGEHYGLYTQVEQIDADYLIRNNREPLALYKAKNHGGLMAPSVRDDYYRLIWDLQEGGDPTFNELRVFLNKCLYMTKEDFDANIESLIDIDNFINFFAIHFVFVDLDNFTKNIFLNKNSYSNKFELLPWDNEGSFGNTAIGEYVPDNTKYNFKGSYTPEYQVILQRLLENPVYKQLFKTKTNKILTDGYSFLDTLIDNTYQRIKQSAYADTKKEATNEDFDNAIPRIKQFMSERKAFLQSNELPNRHPLYNLHISNPFPSVSNPDITIQISSPVAQNVNIYMADSVNFNRFGQPFKLKRLQLYDDGLHNDMLAGDLIYGNTLNTNTLYGNLIPFTFTGGSQNFPPNGIFYVDYYASKTYAINKGNVDQDVASRIKIGEVFSLENKKFVQIINTSATLSVDLSYFHLRTDNSYSDFMFKDNVVLAPNETIYIAPSKELGQGYFPDNRSFYSLYYNFDVNSRLHLLSSLLTNVTSKTISSINVIAAQKSKLIFNEINYKPGAVSIGGDWVEIYNPGNIAVDMSGWTYLDSNNSNKFNFPTGFVLQPDDYVVIAEDINIFNAIYPDVTNVLGSAGFGLSGNGENIRLLDKLGQLIDSVHYKTTPPWPNIVSGTGQTLELKNPNLDRNIGENWFVDDKKLGSPGKKNFLTTDMDMLNLAKVSIYPNPTSEDLFIQNNSASLFIEIINLQGIVLYTDNISTNSTKRIDVSSYPKGVYILKARENSQAPQTFKFIVK